MPVYHYKSYAIAVIMPNSKYVFVYYNTSTFNDDEFSLYFSYALCTE